MRLQAYYTQIFYYVNIVERKFSTFFEGLVEMNLKELIEQFGKEKNMNIREIERKAKIKERTIQHWDTSEPSAKKLYQVAIALDVPTEELLAVYDPELGSLTYTKRKIENKKPSLHLTEEEENIIKLYRRADSHDKDNVKQILSRYEEDTALSVG